ncbi:FtsX-like permease family protein [Pedobacter frigoris]|uniref:FtsX-like permease family protein n=2 Tax=Pedobacter frigoris TaxID=2571272 RepID=A0A4U1CPZ8_9SPHI|nr:FtsX-like permease family protein [Pedobacter frigoris]
MFRMNLKIALRNLWKNKVYTAINIGGLSIALAAFIIVVLYVNYETSYDKNLPNYDRIYLVGRSMPDFKTDYTPAPLAKAIRQNFPEVELAGLTKNMGFEMPVSSDHGKIFSSNALQVESEVAKMFDIDPRDGLPANDAGLKAYLPRPLYKQLFPKESMKPPQMVALGPSNGAQAEKVSGTIDRDDEHSNLKFDLLALGNDISFGDQDYGANNFKTFIQVKKGTDVKALQEKIDRLYKKEVVKAGVSPTDRRIAGRSVIFLDPLKNLHLRPAAGSDANYKVVMALFGLGILVMVIACINFTNLTIAQATKRAKEVGVKKVLGAYRFNLTFQFLAEIFMQCVLALIMGLIVAEILLPVFNNLFSTPLSLWRSNTTLYWQLPLLLLLITIISGIYPALVLSGFKPAAVLKGNLQTSYKTLWLRNALLAGQFGIAIIFITGLFIVNSQLKYMRTEDTGFKPEQVISIKNMVLYSQPWSFRDVREKISKIPGVNYVTVASDIPDGSKAGTMNYKIDGKEASSDFLYVDFDYFETLGIRLKEGRLFSWKFNADTANSAILNESAVARYGVKDPVGKTIRGCDIDYKIVGVVKDFKSQGFQTAVEPTVYTIKNPCGNFKTKIMINVDEQRMALVLTTLKSQWSSINKLDGDDFRYDFLDELYGRLFKKQEQLQAVFFFAAVLTIFIAVLGLFAFSAFTTNSRIKEISIRKVLGATDFQVLKLLNTYFIWIILVANLVAWPLTYMLAKKWLQTFAYRIEMPILPFLVAAVVTSVLTIIIVSIQAQKAVRRNPAEVLKYE